MSIGQEISKPNRFIAGIAASSPAADDMYPAADPAVWAEFVSKTLSRLPKAAKAEKPNTAEIIEAPNDQPILRPI